MNAHELMTDVPRCIDVEAPLRDAAELMAKLKVRALPVADGSRLVGLVTDRDLVVRAMAQDADAATTAVSEVMTRGAATCFYDTPDWESRRVLELVGAEWLVVLDHQSRVVGVLGRSDLDALPSGGPSEPLPRVPLT